MRIRKLGFLENMFNALSIPVSVQRVPLSKYGLNNAVLHKIAFQYYPLDLNATTNPFLVSWWPLALGDPALFHVSLQTACLDEELLAQKGFQASEALMADSLALLRRKVQDTSLAVQDGTINSVITLASIEFGKGNVEVSETHVDGVKALVNMRGGINAVRQTSPLTARMVSWVSMVIMGRPQFDTQDDVGVGDGIPPTPEWQLQPPAHDKILYKELDIDETVENVFNRLRNVFDRTQNKPECVRFAIILYMFTIHGPSYYPHAMLLDTTVARFKEELEKRETQHYADSMGIWFYSIAMEASSGSSHYTWFVQKARAAASALGLQTSDEAISRMKGILWLGSSHGEEIYARHWDAVWASTDILV
ncbi:hypothetical protein N7470_004939 [Penicillium chermesinum]|nr:hypothetical protein N7470_004939 [Penicillium chermesinum]